MWAKVSSTANFGVGSICERFEHRAHDLRPCDGDWPALEAAYDVALTQNVADGETRRGWFMRWGLVPSWAKNASIGSRMITARAKTVAEKPTSRDALRVRRCLLLADGFHEWQRIGALGGLCASSCGRKSPSHSRFGRRRVCIAS